MLKNQSMMKPILFLANNLANCLSRKFQNFFDKGQLAKNYRNPEKFIKHQLDGQVSSYHYNKFGESLMFYPGQIENPQNFKFRIR